MDALGVARYRACGTAGLREASNREEFLAAAAKAGVSVEIISAREEARRTWEGAVGKTRGGALVMDIGGVAAARSPAIGGNGGDLHDARRARDEDENVPSGEDRRIPDGDLRRPAVGDASFPTEGRGGAGSSGNGKRGGEDHPPGDSAA